MAYSNEWWFPWPGFIWVNFHLLEIRTPPHPEKAGLMIQWRLVYKWDCLKKTGMKSAEKEVQVSEERPVIVVWYVSFLELWMNTLKTDGAHTGRLAGLYTNEVGRSMWKYEVMKLLNAKYDTADTQTTCQQCGQSERGITKTPPCVC